MSAKVKVGIIGCGFEADIHAASFQIMPEEAEVVAVASPTPGHPEALAQEMHHFARCVRGRETPIATGEDGRLVQEVLLAGYRSARVGAKINLPFRPTGISCPTDLWQGAVGDEES